MANLLKFYRGAVAPAAQVGMIWFDTANLVLKVCTAAPEGAEATWEVYGTTPADLVALAARVNTLETVTIPGLETSLKALITAEETRAKAEEARIEGLVTAEVTRATGVEAGLETRLAAVEADYLKAADKTELSDAIAAEKTRAEGKEAELLAAIEAEATTARAAEKANADAIAVEKGRLDVFLADADVTDKAVDTLKEIQEYITTHGEAAATMVQNIADNKAAIETEVTRATTAEGVLQAAIEGEAAQREAEMATLKENIQKYADDAVAAEAALREAGDTANTAAIEAEVARATAAEEAIAADLATLDAEVQEHEVVVAAALTGLNERVTPLEASVADHETRLTQAEADIDALEGALAAKNVAADSTTPDYVTASAADNKVTVAATQKVIDAVALAETSVQTITSDNECLTAVKTDNNVALSLCWMEGSF